MFDKLKLVEKAAVIAGSAVVATVSPFLDFMSSISGSKLNSKSFAEVLHDSEERTDQSSLSPVWAHKIEKGRYCRDYYPLCGMVPAGNTGSSWL